MKKISIVLGVFLIVGCASTTQSEPILPAVPVSEIYQIEGNAYPNRESDNDEILRKRLALIQNEKVEALIIVDSLGKEMTVSDTDELNRFTSYLGNLELSEVSTNTGEKLGIGVKIKDYEPILINVQGNQLCMRRGFCRAFESDEDFVSLLKSLKGSEKIVQPFSDLDLAITHYDEKIVNSEVIVNSQHAGTDIEPMNYDSEQAKDPWLVALKMAFFIDEDFTDYHDIQNQEALTAGLINQSEGYLDEIDHDNFNFYGNDGEIFTLEKEIDQLFHRPQPDALFIVPGANLLAKGRERFGSDYEIPDFGRKLLYSYSFQSYEAYQDQGYFVNHVPYELIGFFTFDYAKITDMKESGKERTYQLLRYQKGSDYINGEAYRTVTNKEGKVYNLGLVQESDKIADFLVEHRNEFDLWEYVLEEMSDGSIQVKSGKLLKESDSNYTKEKLDPSKPYFYTVADCGILNLDIAAAQVFNEMTAGLDEPEYLTYKVNENQGFLSIILYRKNEPKDFVGAIVLDMVTRESVSDFELLQRLKIDIDPLRKSLSHVTGNSENVYLMYAALDYHNYEKSHSYNDFFISSTNQFGFYDADSKQVILFDWEEVQ